MCQLDPAMERMDDRAMVDDDDARTICDAVSNSPRLPESWRKDFWGPEPKESPDDF